MKECGHTGNVTGTHARAFEISAPHCFSASPFMNYRSCHPPLRPLRAAIAALSATIFLFTGCHSHAGLPAADSPAYKQFVSAFYVGLAALQVGNDARADQSLGQAAQIASGEPVAWADWGILALRQRNFQLADERLHRALKLSPNNGRVYFLLGLLDDERGSLQPAISDFQRAANLDPGNVRPLYALAMAVERQRGAGSQQKFQQIIEQILAKRPDNVAALVELARIAARRGDMNTAQMAVSRLAALSGDWPAPAKQQLAVLQTATSSGNSHAAALRSVFLRNVLLQVPAFRASLTAIMLPPGDQAEPFTHFLRLPNPSSAPAAPDTAMKFLTTAAPELSRTSGAQHWSWIGAISLDGEGTPTLAVADGRQVRLSTGASFPFPGGASATPPSPEGVLPIDFNFDFKTDLVLAGLGGVRLLRQESPSVFTAVTAKSGLPADVLKASYTGAWAVDIEPDGDLDIVLGQDSGLPTVLRNNGDGTFSVMHPFPNISGIHQFVWADLNGDGIADAAVIDGAGHLHIFLNQRAARFAEAPVPAQFAAARAIVAADIAGRSMLSLVAVLPDGTVASLASAANGGWSATTLAHVTDPAASLAGDVRLYAADVDNNGAVDLLLAQVSLGGRAGGAQLWLGEGGAKFVRYPAPVGSAEIFGVADIKADGHLALFGISQNGQPQIARTESTKPYHWQTIRPRARQATGDQRVNSFGIGGQVQIRSGLLTQTAPINSPQLHFGLGTHDQTDVARIEWPNGTVSAEFGLKADQQILTEQRLKGSCPFLFAWNGHAMKFVMDTVPWGSALGLRINNIGTAAIAATTEWYKIPGRDLVPRHGAYDLRITGELWETYYYDFLSLMVVDHPQGTEIYTDERYAIPPVKQAITVTGEPHAIARAVDDQGNDMTETVRALDGRYVDTFGEGQYQGVARSHYLQIDLGKDFPTSQPVYLIAQGWLHPSDSTVNVAMSQGHHERPQPLSLSVQNADGTWRVVRPNLGFPEGRNKTCLIDLTGLIRPGAPKRIRLSSNLEIYWDRVQWAQGLPDAKIRVSTLAPAYADLHYRGYSVIHQNGHSSPEIPDYRELLATTQIWRDLTGYYTRFGDVRPLLRQIDDRYVIMNAGDELALRFPAPASPPAGWVRDYVLAGDGWVKDGDFNSVDSATVRPLPYHARRQYDTPPLPLEDEWVYRHHSEDWETYQTRYVTPDVFTNALESGANQ